MGKLNLRSAINSVLLRSVVTGMYELGLAILDRLTEVLIADLLRLWYV